MKPGDHRFGFLFALCLFRRAWVKINPDKTTGDSFSFRCFARLRLLWSLGPSR